MSGDDTPSRPFPRPQFDAALDAVLHEIPARMPDFLSALGDRDDLLPDQIRKIVRAVRARVARDENISAGTLAHEIAIACGDDARFWSGYFGEIAGRSIGESFNRCLSDLRTHVNRMRLVELGSIAGNGIPDDELWPQVRDLVETWADSGSGAEPLITLDLSVDPPPIPDPLVGDDTAQLIMPGEATAIASDPGIGKTKTLSEIALGVASGTPALGFRCQQQPVVYVSSDGDPELHRNITRQWAARGPDAGRLADLPLFIASDDSFVLDHPGCRARLEKTLQKAGADKGPALCIVESLATNVLEAEDLIDQVRCRLLINRTVRAMMKTFPGLTVIMSCHLRKMAPGKTGNDLPSRVAGSMQIRGAFDSVLGLVGTGRDAFAVRRIKRSRSGGDFESFKVQIRGGRGEPLTLTSEGTVDVSIDEARGAARAVLEFMRQTPGVVELKAIVANVKNARERAVQAACKRLSEADSPRLRRISKKPATYQYIGGHESDDLEGIE